ncbi:MAG: alpha/beta hydrolase [Nitrospira sp.]|nr:alpha/beta hydrolase [Nitrospira sp.]
MPKPNLTGIKDHHVHLNDRRWLGYAEYGDLAGKPVFFFHGLPGSRLQHHPDNSIASSLHARILAMDRPGFGISTYKSGRRLLDWPDDVVELADALKIDRFAVVGVSGGGPYAAACAYKIPHRLTAVTLVSSLAPLDSSIATYGMVGPIRRVFTLAQCAPWLLRPVLSLVHWVMGRHGKPFLNRINGLLPESDNRVLIKPDIRAMFQQDFAEAIRAGIRGTAHDLTLLSSPWGFQLKDISTQVSLWHGEEDRIVPPQMGRYLACMFPNCSSMFLAGEGHYLVFNHLKEILAVLVS